MSTFCVLPSIDLFFFPRHSVCFVLSLLPEVFIGHPMGDRERQDKMKDKRLAIRVYCLAHTVY